MVRRSGLWTKKPTSDEAQDNEGTFQIVQSRRAYVENSSDRSPITIASSKCGVMIVPQQRSI